jgi:hypothetical protein
MPNQTTHKKSKKSTLNFMLHIVSTVKTTLKIVTVLRITFQLKMFLMQFSVKGKCADADGISSEHFFHAPLSLFVRLKVLFDAMLRHSCVPKQFRFGFIIPLVKDHQGNLDDVGNYRVK